MSRQPRVWLASLALALVLIPVALNEVVWSRDHQDVGFGGDYYFTIWQPGRAVLDGTNPWPSPDSPTLASAESNYPPTLFVTLVPLSIPSFSVSRVVWAVVVAAFVLLTLLAVRVRDPRCHVLWLLSAPAVAGFMWGNVTLVLAAAAALVWRWRDRPVAAGLALGGAIAAKFMLAPLILWLLLTRRARAAGIALAAAVALLLAAWAAIGFEGLSDYPRLLQRASEEWVDRGLLISALVAQAGAGSTLAILVGGIVALGFLGLSFVLRADERASYAIGLIAVMYATPIFHVFNFALMVVALAIVFPLLSWQWLIVPLLWLAAHIGPLADGTYFNYDLVAFSIATTIAVSATIAMSSWSDRSRPPASGLLHTRLPGHG